MKVVLYGCDVVFEVKRIDEDGYYFLEDSSNGNIVGAEEEHIALKLVEDNEPDR